MLTAVVMAPAGCDGLLGLSPPGPTPPPQYTLFNTSSAGGSVIQPGEGAYTYEQGTVVQLVAKATDGYQFDRWMGDVQTVASIWAASTTITINSNYIITAIFARQIRDWNDLRAIDDNLGGTYVLMNHLDSSTAGYDELAGQTANGGEGWQPIGDWADSFSGTFNGQSYEIRDLFIDRPAENYVGLFGAVDEGGVIEDVRLLNISVRGHEDVGGLIGWNEGVVTDCCLKGSVAGSSYVGGLVGDNWGGIVSDSCVEGSVAGDHGVGGLLGWNEGIVNRCHFAGNVDGGVLIGGLIGNNWGGTVNCSHSEGSVSGHYYVGGLTGDNGDGHAIDCYSSANCAGTSWVGGLTGASSGAISNCYSSGTVSGIHNTGGLVGWNDGTVGNCFWDIETSGTDQSDGGVGKTTAEMKNIATFSDAGWNIVAVAPDNNDTAYTWNIVNGETYPFLSWQ